MKRLVHEGLVQGAVGLSPGLTYAPGMYATDDELVELCAVMRETGGYYTPHHRNYGMTALEGYRDCIDDRAPRRVCRSTTRTPTSASPSTGVARRSCSR